MNGKTRTMLGELADLLEALPPERFDYSCWVGPDWKGDPELSCGTTACAAGWATTLPSFQAAGLNLLPGGSIGSATVGTNVDGVVPYTLLGAEALAKVLDISYDEAVFLFIPSVSWPDASSAPGPDASADEVAAHIRRFVAARPPEDTANIVAEIDGRIVGGLV